MRRHPQGAAAGGSPVGRVLRIERVEVGALDADQDSALAVAHLPDHERQVARELVLDPGDLRAGSRAARARSLRAAGAAPRPRDRPGPRRARRRRRRWRAAGPRGRSRSSARGTQGGSAITRANRSSGRTAVSSRPVRTSTRAASPAASALPSGEVAGDRVQVHADQLPLRVQHREQADLPGSRSRAPGPVPPAPPTAARRPSCDWSAVHGRGRSTRSSYAIVSSPKAIVCTSVASASRGRVMAGRYPVPEGRKPSRWSWSGGCAAVPAGGRSSTDRSG